jgi:peptidoglycan/xylan/chitin deacetylase (PgdA/CDA1 family)
MLKVALSHDVDRIRKTYQYITKTGRVLLKFDFRQLRRAISDIGVKRPYWGFDEIILIEQKFDVRSTFFFLNETIPFELFHPGNWKLSLGRYKFSEEKVAGIIRWLDENGWEIALHGSYRSFNDKELLKTEKADLERILNHQVIGVRQHYMNLDASTWVNQYEAGFKYDSTWGLGDAIGFRENRVMPFFPLNNEFCVIPFTVMDSCFASTKNRWERLEELTSIATNQGALIVINWHSNNYDATDFPSYRDDYIEIIRRFKDKGAKFYTLSEYYSEITRGNNYQK